MYIFGKQMQENEVTFIDKFSAFGVIVSITGLNYLQVAIVYFR